MTLRVRHELPALTLLLALVAIQLWPAAGPARLPESLDLMLQYVPNAAFLQRSLSAGHIPLWNPFLGTGMPFAADPGVGAWYLPAWPVLVALPLEAAVRALLWLHLAWAALGTYAFCRAGIGAGRIASLVGAIAFALTTWMPGLTGMPAVLTSLSWLPWILLCGISSVDRGGRWPAALGAAGALQVMSGWPAGAYLAWLALGIVLIARGARLTGWTRLVVAGVAAALLAGVLLVPAVELIGESSYAETRSVEAAGREAYVTLLSWLRPASGTGSLESSQLYVGVAAPLLAAVAAMGWRRSEVRALLVLLVVSTAIGLGTRTPLFAALYAWLPGFRIVYLPARLGAPASFALAGLAAMGAQAVADGRVTRRGAAGALAIVAVLVPLMLLQFWHSEGYDAFRRLLTNLGRATGGPYLTRAQELHYVLVGLAGGGILSVGVSGRWRLAPAALCGLVALDALAAFQLSQPSGFDPAAWYSPAFRTAGKLGTDSERIAGAQWHGTQHFLSDFPRSADPTLLPPNLALLVAVRDAQGYNPLLLRRAATYFARANARERSDALPDEHWLWLEDFGAREVDRLAVARVLAAEDVAWRVRGRRVMAPTTLRAGTAAVRAVVTAETAATSSAARLHVVTYLGEATALHTGNQVAELVLTGANGVQREALRVGEHTAEWAYGRPDVARSVAHRQAPIALETQLVDAVAGRYRVYEYHATFDVASTGPLVEIAISPTLPSGSQVSLNVSGIWLESGAMFPTVGDGVLRNVRAVPRVTVTSGSVATLNDSPELLDLRVASAGGTTLTVADVFYPGWVARIDGAPAAIGVAEGVFREVNVPAGDHTVALSYEPVSLTAGAALTALGVLWLVGLLFWPNWSTIRRRWSLKTSRP